MHCKKIEFIQRFVLQEDGRLDERDVRKLQELVYAFYQNYGRDFAWRRTVEPYHIVVSEIMLQQTQTVRVIEKYEQFIMELPTFETLAHAHSRDVLRLWSGLGYNRRALALQKIAQRVLVEYGGKLPADVRILQTFSGIGPNTAGSICAFAFNIPTMFIETNIRSVFLATCFCGSTGVNDKQIIPLVEQVLDKNNPRLWYYALMDYGVMLKKHLHNPSRASAHHAHQSSFKGSERQIRGMIIKLLTNHISLTCDELCLFIGFEEQRIVRNLKKLCFEGLVHEKNNVFFL